MKEFNLTRLTTLFCLHWNYVRLIVNCAPIQRPNNVHCTVLTQFCTRDLFCFLTERRRRGAGDRFIVVYFSGRVCVTSAQRHPRGFTVSRRSRAATRQGKRHFTMKQGGSPVTRPPILWCTLTAIMNENGAPAASSSSSPSPSWNEGAPALISRSFQLSWFLYRCCSLKCVIIVVVGPLFYGRVTCDIAHCRLANAAPFVLENKKKGKEKRLVNTVSLVLRRLLFCFLFFLGRGSLAWVILPVLRSRLRDWLCGTT